MKDWPDSAGTLVRRYLRTLGLRSSGSQRCVLNNFQRFVAGRAGDEPFALSTVESWLQERARDWSLRTLAAGAQSVDRFLDWLVANNLLAANQWSDLCRQYGQRTAPIVRAILSPDPAQALGALRPLPRFGSYLGEAMLKHIQRMRSLGFRYEREASRLLGFDRYLQQRPEASLQPLSLLVREMQRWPPRRKHGWNDYKADEPLRGAYSASIRPSPHRYWTK
jgi:integrase/recombinase XerD